MQKWLFPRHDIEVTGLVPELNVRAEERRRQKTSRVAQHVGRKQDKKSRCRDHNEHRKERGKYPAHPAFVETAETESALAPFVLDELRDQIARNHEKDVDADKAAAEGRNAEMKKQYGQDRKRAQAVDLRPVRVRNTAPNAHRQIRLPHAGLHIKLNYREKQFRSKSCRLPGSRDDFSKSGRRHSAACQTPRRTILSIH